MKNETLDQILFSESTYQEDKIVNCFEPDFNGDLILVAQKTVPANYKLQPQEYFING